MIQIHPFKLEGLAVFALVLLSAQAGFGQQSINWATQADTLRGRNGQQFTFTCPAGGPISSRLWGTNVYTDDSSICTAAVHAGYIELASGGMVTIEIRPGQTSYAGVTRNEITSKGYGSWPGSFVFVGRVSGSANANWAAQADGLRGRNDSSICVSAVHAGLITLARGGRVTIEIRAGASSYAGTARNGVKTKNYGAYSGSFVFVQ